MIPCCPNAFLDSFRCSGVRSPLHSIPWLGTILQLSLLTSPLGCSFGNGLGIPVLAVLRHRGECTDTPSCPSPTASHAGHAAPRCEDTDSCQHELIYIFLKMFLVWDMLKACFSFPGFHLSQAQWCQPS